MAGAADASMDRPGSLLLPFALSLFMHALLLLSFVAGALKAPQSEEQPFQVELMQPQAEPPPSAQAKAPPAPQSAEKPAVAPPPEQAVPPPKSQIVSPPDSPEQTPEKAHLFSDRDSKALE
jgi:protein TonB